MTAINTAYLSTLNPCKNRFDNWKNHYGEWSGSLSEFLDLQNITHKDKLWVFFRSIDLSDVPLIAADFAERVLPLFETKFPGDCRPRQAITAARSSNAAAAAARAAAYAADAADAAAAYAADAAAAAAAYAAAAARAAADAAYAADAADAAADAAAAARAASILDEEPAQIEIMKDYLKRKEVKNEK